MLVAVAGIDLDDRIVPNKILLPAALWGLATAVAFRSDMLGELLRSPVRRRSRSCSLPRWHTRPAWGWAT